MCPTFMATRDEDKTTRGRANILREFLYSSEKENPFDQKEIYDILIEKGIDETRMEYLGFGKTRPLVWPEKTEEDENRNRRVEIRILKK